MENEVVVDENDTKSGDEGTRRRKRRQWQAKQGHKGTRAQGQGQAEPTGRVPTKATKPTQQHRASLMIPARWPKPRLENMSSSLKLRQ